MKHENTMFMTFGFIIVLGVIIGLILTGTRGNGNEFSCEYESTLRNYLGKSLEECVLLDFFCDQGEKNFADECGCGCESIANEESNDENNASPNNTEIQHICSPESRSTDACSTIYIPVCGWFDPERVQCIDYPCAVTVGNGCEACLNEDILYWTEGECPSI